jgi:hypothetical protein
MSALKPDAVNTHDLGTSALPWKDLHVDQITMGARAGGTTLTLGSAALLTGGDAVDLVVHGNLTVNGQTTTLSSQTLEIEDKEIILARSATNSNEADGAGLLVAGATASLLYEHANTQWELNRQLEVAGSILPELGAKASADLGSTTLPWNDLHLSDGGIINFNNGDITVEHSANLLTITGGHTKVDRLEIDSADDYIDVSTDLTLTASVGIVLDAATDIVLDADGDDITFKAGADDSTGLKWSQSNSGDWTNLVGTQDKDLIFQVNDGGAPTEVMRLDGDVSSLLMAGTKKITFGDEGSFIHQSAGGKLAISSDGADADAIVITSSDLAGGIDIDAGTGGISIDSTGAFSIDGEAASNITVTTNADGEDLTISVAGDTNSSLILSSSGTAADALSISTSAGGIDITVAGAAANEDLDLTSNTSINITGAEDADDAVVISGSNGGVTIDAGGDSPVEINASGAAINIGNDDVNQNINIGGDGNRTINIGVDGHANTIDLSAQTLTLDAGTNGFTIDGAANSSVSTSDGELTVNGKTGVNLQEDGENVIAIDTNRDVLFSQTGGSIGDPNVEFDGYVRFDGASEFVGAVQVDGTLTANAAVSVQSTLTVGEDDTGYDVVLYGDTTGKRLLWDQSADELALIGSGTKLSFFAAAGGENISADNTGVLSVNAGDQLTMTAPTVLVDASEEVTIDTDTVTVGSANASDPLFVLKNTTNDPDGARLRFVKDKGAAGTQGDDAGVIQFFADNAAQQQTEFARVTAEVQTATAGEEGGKLSLSVAEHDGTMTAGLVLTEGSTDGVIDVTIGAGSGSTTTIAGNLTVNGTTTTVNSTTVQVDDKNIELGVGSVNDAAADGGGITLKSGDGDKTFNWVNVTNSWTSSENLDLVNGKHLSIAGTTLLTAEGVAKVQSGVAGAGLSHSSGVLAVGVDESSIEINSDALRVKAAGITNAMLEGSIENAKLSNSSVTVTAGDGLSGGGVVSLGGTVSLAVGVDDSSIEINSDTLRVKASGITNEMLEGSIADSKLLAISTANKVEASAFELSANTAMEDDAGLCLKENIAGDGLAITEADGNQVLSVRVDDSSIEIDSDVLRVKEAGITNAMLEGSIANEKLAGSIANEKLSNSSITFAVPGGASEAISLGQTVFFGGTDNEVDVSYDASINKFTFGLPNDVTLAGDLSCQDITAAGLSATGAQISFADNLLELGVNNVSAEDIGFYGQRGTGVATNGFAGFGFDEGDDEFKCFTSSGEPSSDFSAAAGFSLADLRVKNIATEGKVTHAVTETTSGDYTVDADQDDYIIDANHTITLVDATAGRELIIVNTSGGDLTITTSDNSNLYIDGNLTALGGNSNASAVANNKTLKLIGVGGHWYSV